MHEEEQIDIQQAYQVLCRREFWEFCKYMAPEFYKEDRPHLKVLCDTLQAFYRNKLLNGQTPYRKLAISIPPRLGKSRTLELFETWVFGLNHMEKIMTISYNETLSISFSKNVRNKIQTESVTDDIPTVNYIFPELKIKQGSASAQLWTLEGAYMSYLGGSPTGTLTGFGASLAIIDDLIKNAYEAMNERILDEHYVFYTNTLRQRLEEGHKVIVNFTRWSTDDLIGRLLKDEPGEWYVLTMEAMKDGQMLCDELLSHESYKDIESKMLPNIFNANYHQKPIDVAGRLYSGFKTYTERPKGIVYNYTDTADEGNCYLCSIDYIKHKKEIYVINVLYTPEPMEKTEPATAEMLYKDRVTKAFIESNNGGKGFARNIKRILLEKYKSNYTVIKWFHQSANKIARIKTMSAWAQEHIHFPENWNIIWPEFYRDIMTFNADKRGQLTDGADALTGVCEKGSTDSLTMF